MAEDRSTHDPAAAHDAQRDMEQRALRNVRGLVERIQAEDEVKHRSQKWVVGVLVAVLAVLAIVLLASFNRKPGGQEIVIQPASKAPAR